ncbi:hypothetical protein [Chryseobacterium turcicum]|uniref:Lipoprotein n=1 Tax=Chryseobacterium turcicum TaxID=2898076 RepID=A0A9Q3YTV5_9FLAO|nr:hypothetical protein [Chryseobacterium turcicum]MCD1115646.1 hypothetical protein [Chryseobacterium turcicum]
MKNFIFLLLFLMLSCKKDEHVVKILPKDETLDLKYEVLNQLINMFEAKNSEHNYVYNISLKTTDFDALFYNDNGLYPPPSRPSFGIEPVYDGAIFLKSDSIFYQKQAELFRSFKLDKKRINRKLEYTNADELEKLKNVKGSYFWKEFGKKYKNKCLKTLCIPFFNKDKTVCIVLDSSLCDSLEGEYFHMAIYKKVQGKWTEISSYNYIIG